MRYNVNENLKIHQMMFLRNIFTALLVFHPIYPQNVWKSTLRRIPQNWKNRAIFPHKKGLGGFPKTGQKALSVYMYCNSSDVLLGLDWR